MTAGILPALPAERSETTMTMPAVEATKPTTRRAQRSAPGGRLVRGAAPYVLLAVAQVVVALEVDLPVLRPVLALSTFVVLPTLVLHRRARFPADTAAARLLYALGLSLLGLIVGGLVLDTVLPIAGVAHPLAPMPLAVAWLVADAALLTWRRSVPLVLPGAARVGVRRALDARLRLAPTLAVAGFVLSIAGAVRLNNGAGGAVALSAQAVCAAALLALLLGRTKSLSRDVWVLGLVAAGLLLATSLRGWNITGHDIQAEFLAFRLTDGPQNWDIDALPNAYNACLSVTILPTILVQATGLSGELVFKVLLQLVFATVPVLTYLFGRRVVGRRLALVGAVLTIAFPTFSTDMPYLVRQEIAFFFLALMLLAATEPGRTRVATRVLVLALGVGMILSHYSTTYLFLMALVIGLAGLAATGLVRRRGPERSARDSLVLLHPLVIGVLVVLALSWAGPITGTGGHAGDVVSETVDALTGKGDGGPGSSDTSYWIFAGDKTTPRERMDMFVEETIGYRDAQIPEDQQLIGNPGDDVLAPELHEQATAPLTSLGQGLDAVGLDPVQVNKAARLGGALLMQVFALIGLAWLLRRQVRRRGREDSRPKRPSREVAFLTWGAMGALALVVLIPNLSVDYGVLRAFQQTLLVIAPVMAMGMWVALRPLATRAPRARKVLAAVVPVAILAVLAGVLPAILGGQQQRMSLANGGTYYDRFFASDAEMQGMLWLGAADHADKVNERIIASRNVNVRLLALSDNRAPVADRLFPTLLSKDAYVFVDDQILDQGVSTVFYTGDLLTYTYPLQVLDRRMDLLYSSPDARVYK